MKINVSKTMILLGVFSLLLGSMTSFGVNFSYADNLEIIGTDLGLEVKPSGTKLFNLTNLNPGDTKEAKIDIKNNYTLPFEVFMRTERTSPQPIEGDLFEQLILTIYLENIEIYSGPMKDYAISNISLGNFNSNSEKELRAVVHLPGAETGNEFQGKSLEVKWYFIAQLNEEPEPPGPGPGPGPGPEPEPEPGPGPRPRPRPRVPEEIDIIQDDIPLSVPEITEDDRPLDEPEIIEEEIEEDEIPLGKPEIPLSKPKVPKETVPTSRGALPKTGELSPMMFYGAGMLFILIGANLEIKKKK